MGCDGAEMRRCAAHLQPYRYPASSTEFTRRSPKSNVFITTRLAPSDSARGCRAGPATCLRGRQADTGRSMNPEYESLTPLGADDRFELLRGRRTRTGAPVLLKR